MLALCILEVDVTGGTVSLSPACHNVNLTLLVGKQRDSTSFSLFPLFPPVHVWMDDSTEFHKTKMVLSLDHR